MKIEIQMSKIYWVFSRELMAAGNERVEGFDELIEELYDFPIKVIGGANKQQALEKLAHDHPMRALVFVGGLPEDMQAIRYAHISARRVAIGTTALGAIEAELRAAKANVVVQDFGPESRQCMYTYVGC